MLIILMIFVQFCWVYFLIFILLFFILSFGLVWFCVGWLEQYVWGWWNQERESIDCMESSVSCDNVKGRWMYSSFYLSYDCHRVCAEMITNKWLMTYIKKTIWTIIWNKIKMSSLNAASNSWLELDIDIYYMWVRMYVCVCVVWVCLCAIYYVADKALRVEEVFFLVFTWSNV